MKKHFIDLFSYNDWANNRIMVTVEELKQDNDQVLKLFSHLISAQIIWFNRINDIPTSPFPLWEKYKLRELKSMTEESSRNWLRFIDEHRTASFEEMIFYKNSKGVKFESTLREIMTHVVNHGTYHRGQIADQLRELGLQPDVTDYIAYCRQK